MNTKVLFAILSLSPLAIAQQVGDAARLTGANDRINTPAQPKPAQSGGDSSETEMSVEEFEDVGPLRVLNAAPRHRWFEAGVNTQVFYTDNVALLESKTQGDVSVLGAHVGVNSKPIRTELGALAFHADYDYSAYFYGVLSGRTDRTLSGSVRKMEQLDFQNHTGTLEAELRRGGMRVATGVRAAAYYESDSGDRAYSEISPYLRGEYTFALSDTDFLSAGAEADYRFSHTPLPAGFADILGTNLNDRFDLGGTLAYTRLFGEHWFVQPAYRLGFAQYTQGGSTPGKDGAGARNITHTVLISAGYAPNNWLLARVFTSFEARESDEEFTPDYHVTNIGLGASVTAKF